MKRLKKYIYEQVAGKNLSQDLAKEMLMEMEAKGAEEKDDIAIIGIAARFPGANDYNEYWTNLEKGICSVGDFPETRKQDCKHLVLHSLNARLKYNTVSINEELLDKLRFVERGYIDDIDKFDAHFFGIPPKEAKYMDPEQRVFLETAFSAIEDAGYGGNQLYGANVGVYVGKDESEGQSYKEVTEPNQMHFTGSITSILAARLSYLNDFGGPSMVIDTACSSGLVAVHQACQALHQQECEYAIAGGIAVGLFPTLAEDTTYSSILESKDSKIRTFDQEANGTVWGEGAGAVVLKPLKKALRDQDHVYAVIKGSAVNCDGASNGITSPNADAQTALLLKAWENAKIDPETISYIEAHGTGTNIGDPIEVKGISNAFKKFTDKNQFCGIGSVKPNIGHLIAASGVASLIKVVLAMKNKKLPPSIHFKNPNTFINFIENPVYVNDKLSPWESNGHPRRAGINSFGISGTNCHLVLEESPQIENKTNEGRMKNIVTLSAKTEKAVSNLVDKYISFIEKEQNINLEDLCATANVGRGHYAYRLALVVDSIEELKNKLLQIANEGVLNAPEQGIYFGKHSIVPPAKVNRTEEEVTEKEIKDLNQQALELLQQYKIVEPKEQGQISQRLCELYVQGSNPNWELIYSGCSKVNIPVYPLEKTRYWAEPLRLHTEDNMLHTKFIHPLLDACLVESMEQEIYGTTLSVEKNWVLNEHNVGGNYVLVGTSYIEMAREACSRCLKTQEIELKNLTFLKPIIVEEEEQFKVHTIVKKRTEGVEFQIVSQGEDGEWNIHVQGEAYSAPVRSIKKLNKEELLKRCDQGQFILDLKRRGAFQFGPRWTTPVCTVYQGKEEVFFKVQVAEEFREEMSHFAIHPAVFDVTANVMTWDLPNKEAVYLPYIYSQIAVSGKMPEEFYGHIKMKTPGTYDAQSVIFDFEFCDLEGNVFLSIEDYAIKRVNQMAAAKEQGSLYHEIRWIEKEAPIEKREEEQSSIMIIGEENEISKKVLEKLEERNKEAIRVIFGDKYEKVDEHSFRIDASQESYDQLIKEMKKNPPRQILHCGALQGIEEVESLESTKERLETGVYSLFRLAKAMLQENYPSSSFTLLSQHVSEIDNEGDEILPENAAVFALERVIANEYDSIDCRCIDFDNGTSIDKIVDEMLIRDGKQHIAYRKDRRYVEELIVLPLEAEKETEPYVFKEEGVYVITGGTGGIGLEIGKHITSKNKVNFALINRSSLPPKEAWHSILAAGEDERTCKKLRAIQEMEQKGSEVNCLPADVSSMEDMSRVLEDLRKKYGKINGILHTAGLAGDGFLITKPESVFTNVITPKIKGTLVLDQLTKKDDLDFMMLFSSVASLVYSPGQSDYTSGNAYQDAFAVSRSKMGRNVISVNWPLWKETGIAADYDVKDHDNLIKGITQSEAMQAFDAILSSGNKRVIVGNLDYDILAQIEEHLPLELAAEIKSLTKNKKAAVKKASASKNKEVTIEVLGLENNDKQSVEYKTALIWAKTLELIEINVYDTFYDMGGDSILATQLIREMNKEFPNMISIADIFTYPSVDLLSNYIKEQLTSQEESAEDAAAASYEEDGDMELMQLLESIESGDATLEAGLEILSNQMGEKHEQ